MSLLATPVNGLVLVDQPDPHGNGQATVEVLHVAADGSVVHSGCFISVHGGGPLNLRIVHGGVQPSSQAVFEVDPATNRAVISEL